MGKGAKDLRIVKFKTNERVRKFVKSKGNDYLIVFYPGTEYEGELMPDGSVICDCGKYPGTYELKKKQVKIIKYL